MAHSSSQKATDEEDPIEEIIFSCSICQATVSDVYTTSESNKGFHSGSGNEDGIVTRMWIAECSHVMCAKHLEGGAAPFHPKGIEPRAACPRCMQTNGDQSLKALYAIRGLREGQCDPAIPSEWRQCPAIKLDSSIPGMEAVRFQYMALGHYARRARRHCKDALEKQHAIETAYSKERKQRRQLQSELLELKDRTAKLEEARLKLESWEKRKPKIFHYLGVFGVMMREIHTSRAVLHDLGYQVSEKRYAFEGDEVAQGEENLSQRRTKGAATGPITGGTTNAAAHDAGGSSSSRKRKHEADGQDYYETTAPPAPKVRGSSRNMMPPPLPGATQARQSKATNERMDNHIARPPRSRGHYMGQLQNALLPFRPTPPQQQSHSVRQPTHHDRLEEVDELLRRQHLAAEEYDDRPYRQLPNMSLHTPSEAQHWRTTGSRLGHAAPPDLYEDPRMAGYDESYGNLTQQSETQVLNGPLPSYLTSPQHNRNPLATRQGEFLATPARNVHLHPSTGAHSPFFKHGPAYSRPESMCPPTRGSYRRSYDGEAQHAVPYAEFRPPTESTFSTELRPSVQESRFDQRREKYLDIYQRPRIMPQTPRNSQGLFQRPDRALPPAMSHASSRPQSNTLRSRVSLRPDNGRGAMSSYGDQDNALSRIQGVRGLTSQQSQPPGYAPSPAFHMPRQLFSAAGNRRSVRR